MYALTVQNVGKVRVPRVAGCYGCQGIGLCRGPAPDVSKIAVMRFMYVRSTYHDRCFHDSGGLEKY